MKNQRTGHISEAISSTHFILGTKVQPNKAHSMTQVPMTLTLGQGQRSRSNFPKNGEKAFSPTDCILGTKVQPNKLHSMTQVSMTLTLGQGQRSRSKFSQNGLNTKQLATSLMLFHPQTSSYLLSQLFVTHLGVALLFFNVMFDFSYPVLIT